MSRERRKGFFAVAMVAVLFGVIASWIWADSISTSRQQDRDNLDLFLDASSAGWAEVTNQFFIVPEVAAQTVGALSVQMEAPGEQLALLAETIRQRPNLDSAYIGYPDGRFYFVARSDEGAPGGFRTRMISFEDDERHLELTWTDAALAVVRSETDPNDTYDPHARPWYEPIAEGVDRNWTDPYLFASSQQQGITHSSAVRTSAGELVAVVGIDIRLSQVNEFLEELSPRDNGSALVIDATGGIIAESSMNLESLARTGVVSGSTMSQSEDLLRLVTEFAQGDGDSLRGRSDDGLSTTIVRFAGASDEWYLAVRAVDADFLDNETASNAFATFAVGVTVAAAVAALGFAGLQYLAGLKKDAEIDELTGVYNRRAVKRELRNLLSGSKRSVHVAIIDLDDFKSINDVHGHAAGDKVLVTLSSRMQEFGERFDVAVGRLGGDEFVIFGNEGTPDWADLNSRLAVPVDIGGQPQTVTASIGVAQSDVTEGEEIEELFRAADHLLFDAKRRGGNHYRTTEITSA